MYKCNLFFLTALLGVIVACNNPTEKPQSGNKPVKDTVATQPTTPTANKEGSYLYKGMGNEPGWYVIITQSGGAKVTAEMVLDYGERKYNGSLLMAQTRDINASITNLQGEAIDSSGSKIAVSIHIEKEKCTDDAGIEHTSKIEMKAGDKAYTGCGDFGSQR